METANSIELVVQMGKNDNRNKKIKIYSFTKKKDITYKTDSLFGIKSKVDNK